MFISATNVSKTEYLLRILETKCKKSFRIHRYYVSNNFG